jgi:hypothetical protein
MAAIARNGQLSSATGRGSVDEAVEKCVGSGAVSARQGGAAALRQPACAAAARGVPLSWAFVVTRNKGCPSTVADRRFLLRLLLIV